jgi:hypothetical protein
LDRRRRIRARDIVLAPLRWITEHLISGIQLYKLVMRRWVITSIWMQRLGEPSILRRNLSLTRGMRHV